MAKNLKLFHASHTGHYIGGDSLVWAYSREEAIALVRDEVIACGIATPEGRDKILVDLTEIKRPKTPHVEMINNGDY